jgi:hypothetical protein
MVIHPPEITVKDGTLTCRACIEHDTAGAKAPRFLRFKMPVEQEMYLSPQSDGLAVNLLWSALLRDEPLEADHFSDTPEELPLGAGLPFSGGVGDLPTFPYGYTRNRLRTTLVPVEYMSVVDDTRRLASARGRHDIAFELSVLKALSLAGAPVKAVARKIRERRETKR